MVQHCWIVTFESSWMVYLLFWLLTRLDSLCTTIFDGKTCMFDDQVSTVDAPITIFYVSIIFNLYVWWLSYPKKTLGPLFVDGSIPWNPTKSHEIPLNLKNDPFIVDLPMKHGDFPWLYKRLPEGKCLWSSHQFSLRNNPWTSPTKTTASASAHVKRSRTGAQPDVGTDLTVKGWPTWQREKAGGKWLVNYIAPIGTN